VEGGAAAAPHSAAAVTASPSPECSG
jgi:hypothetical protein